MSKRQVYYTRDGRYRIVFTKRGNFWRIAIWDRVKLQVVDSSKTRLTSLDEAYSAAGTLLQNLRLEQAA